MTEQEILHGIESVARQHLDHRGELHLEDRLIETLDLDSLRMPTLVAEIENHFRVVLEEGDERGIETVGELVRLVARRHAA